MIKIPAYVITLEPEKKLYDALNDIKSKSKDIAGDQLYINDPPHLTILLGIFEDYKTWKEDFSNFLKKINSDKSIFEFHIDDWHIFSGDFVTKKDTLVCILRSQYIDNLKKLQMEIAEFMLKFKIKQTLKRYKNIDSFNEIEKSNIEKYGYPFIGDKWIPHIGIASFDKDIFKEVYIKLKSSCPKGLYKFSFVNIYELNQVTEQLKIVQKFRI